MAAKAQRVVNEMKPIASLGPLLLARKGAAKPAMRAQLGTDSLGPRDEVDELAASQEDLGWNDMGEDEAVQPEAAAVPPPQPKPAEPAVRRQQSELVHRIADSNLAAFQSAENQKPVSNAESAAEAARRAAFTLRLDEERHLRLRLASTVQGESAQSLVTRALDSLLSQMPEIEDLATKVGPRGRRGPGKA